MQLYLFIDEPHKPNMEQYENVLLILSPGILEIKKGHGNKILHIECILEYPASQP